VFEDWYTIKVPEPGNSKQQNLQIDSRNLVLERILFLLVFKRLLGYKACNCLQLHVGFSKSPKSYALDFKNKFETMCQHDTTTPKVKRPDSNNNGEAPIDDVLISKHTIIDKEQAQVNDALITPSSEASPVEPRIETTRSMENPQLSKRARKKLEKREQWEAERDLRKVKRREKAKERKERKRVQRAEAASTQDPSVPQPNLSKQPQSVIVPVTFLLDCGFDDLMAEKEMVSLTGQITRCYADNQRSLFKPHLALCSFNGKLRDRFETRLSNYKHWKNFRFLDEGFVDAIAQAKEWMNGPGAGIVAGALHTEDKNELEAGSVKDGEVVYLTADSPHTLDRLQPRSTYIIGALVDKNRHKGICYKRAEAEGIKTAKLPIGEFMQMNSRSVLATNHVYEIMLKWLELENWGQAFMEVIPKRKGGVLKEQSDNSTEQDGEPEEASS
jgi:tRNA (guanine9-N1)-methyltransferase